MEFEYGYQPRPQNKPPKRQILLVLGAVVILAILTALIGNASDSKTAGASASPSPIPNTAPDRPGGEEDRRNILTRKTFDIVWGDYNSMERTNACYALDMFGEDRAAREMKLGAGGTNELNWDLMAAMMRDECDAR